MAFHGFGNEFQSEDEAYPGALPEGPINPQRCKHNLFAEQLSGSAFTAPRSSNKRSWLYRLRPSVCHSPLKKACLHESRLDYSSGEIDPNQLRWAPFEDNQMTMEGKVDFIQGMHTLAYSDDKQCDSSSSVAIHIYLANTGMDCKTLTNCDGDYLIVPQEGSLTVITEFGVLDVHPKEIMVIQQGMKFTVNPHLTSEDKELFMRGYVLEVKGNHFELPNLGPIGANGLANPRDFEVPKAKVQPDARNCSKPYQMIVKFKNQLFTGQQSHCPFDVAAWFGNYTPYRYNLTKFVSLNSVSIDHPDPSIFTVLTCPSLGKPGTALADFVIFPPRWECANSTFRPPYYHRNCMTEFMGLIEGQYQAKSSKFAPGGGSLHQSMMAHGPDLECFQMASKQDTSVPRRVADGSLAFMFETSLTLKLTKWSREKNVDNDYHKCWIGLADLSLAKETET